MLKSRFVPRDAFGLADGYPNAKLVADEWAARGHRVLLHSGRRPDADRHARESPSLIRLA
jgi:hypothetical protein